MLMARAAAIEARAQQSSSVTGAVRTIGFVLGRAARRVIASATIQRPDGAGASLRFAST